MAENWYEKKDADSIIDIASVKDRMISTKDMVNTVKNHISALETMLKTAKLEMTNEQKVDLLNEYKKYNAIHDVIIAQGF